MSFLVFVLIFCGLVGFLIKSYNVLRLGSEQVKRAHSDLLGMLRKRATLVNQLIDICRGYGDHEKLTHITVAESASSLAESASMSRQVDAVMDRVTAITTRFPELKANGTYEKLMDQIHHIENDIQDKREAYNRCVEGYNTQRATFPNVLFSESIGFPPAPYFSTDESGLENTAIFSTDDGTMLRDTMRRLGDKATSHGKALAQQAQQHVSNARSKLSAAAQDQASAVETHTASHDTLDTPVPVPEATIEGP